MEALDIATPLVIITDLNNKTIDLRLKPILVSLNIKAHRKLSGDVSLIVI